MLNQKLSEEQEFRIFFARRLRTARLAANLSQKGLAHRLQIGQDTISNYERCKAIPDILTVFRLAQALQVEIVYFFP